MRLSDLDRMEFEFKVEDADLSKLAELFADVNIKETPWFDISDKHGNSARYYREGQWTPCSEWLPELDDEVLVTDDSGELRHCIFCTWDEAWCGFITYEEGMRIKATAWMPLPPAYKGDE